ncbi:protein of unknown function [Candidatus Nitrosocosmicus franklandus]|uniref:Uncharacterized protein n=1 Tax=Candidatus Nitrosocosmicus franklandianus TaxID=1798806 RepID=A0A484I865_9ARCH|nr:protein of unknown function [Candidatus Nitrosocosmicus franklandus]
MTVFDILLVNVIILHDVSYVNGIMFVGFGDFLLFCLYPNKYDIIIDIHQFQLYD